MATSFVPPLSKLNNSKRLLSYYIIFHGHIIYTTAFQTIFAPENFRLWKNVRSSETNKHVYANL